MGALDVEVHHLGLILCRAAPVEVAHPAARARRTRTGRSCVDVSRRRPRWVHDLDVTLLTRKAWGSRAADIGHASDARSVWWHAVRRPWGVAGPSAPQWRCMPWRNRGLLGAAAALVLNACGVTEGERYGSRKASAVPRGYAGAVQVLLHPGLRLRRQACLEVFFEYGRSPALCLFLDVCDKLECEGGGALRHLRWLPRPGEVHPRLGRGRPVRGPSCSGRARVGAVGLLAGVDGVPGLAACRTG